MANLKEVRGRISSVKSTQQITKAMKMVAAAKLRKAQQRILQIRPYSEKLEEVLTNVTASSSEELLSIPFSKIRPVESVLIIPISSDRGLCGAFNSNINKATISLMEDPELKGADVTLMPLGKKVRDFFVRRDYNVLEDFYTIFENLEFDQALPAINYALDGFLKADYDKVYLVYNEFKNAAVQIVRKEQFLPILPLDPDESDTVSGVDYIFEPDSQYIAKELIPFSLRIQLYKALLDSFASEQGARMTAMNQATDNATELLNDLQLIYNRSRQAAITTEILEIVGGAEALAAEG